MPDEAGIIQRVEGWWTSLRPVRQHGNLPAKGSLGGAIQLLERLKSDFDLDIGHHRARRGESQIRGIGGTTLKRVLERHGEGRPFLSEGGRTNRGLAGELRQLLDALRPLELGSLTQRDREALLDAAQGYLVAKVSLYYALERVKFSFDDSKTATALVRDILASAREVGKEGQVAQYLVGAKLALRFPTATVRNDKYSTSSLAAY